MPQAKAEIGSLVTEEVHFKKPKDNPLCFSGRQFVLTGRTTFSSANCFASAIKCFNIATLIGEETGGTTTSYGDCLYFYLPNSNLRFDVAHKYFVEACGKSDGRGVIPDYEVNQKPEDTARGVDTVLQFTLDLIKNAGRPPRGQPRGAN
jgi:C-terminal processing protease CtpA/Prc